MLLCILWMVGDGKVSRNPLSFSRFYMHAEYRASLMAQKRSSEQQEDKPI